VASGVTSLSAKPVPPVVKITSSFKSSAYSTSLASMIFCSSGIMAVSATCQPFASTISWIAGPALSSLSPRDPLSLTVIIPTLIIFPRSLAGRHRALVVAALAPGLLHQVNITDDHVLLHGLAHVINGQGRHRHRRQGFHFHPGLAGVFHRGLNVNVAVVFIEVERKHHGGKHYRVAHGDDVRRPLSPQDPGDLGHRQEISFGDPLLVNPGQGGGLHPHFPPGYG